VIVVIAYQSAFALSHGTDRAFAALMIVRSGFRQCETAFWKGIEMKRALMTTTALSLAFSPMGGMPLSAQTVLMVGEQPVVCVADANSCPEEGLCITAVEGTCDGVQAFAAATEAVTAANAEADAARLAEEEAAIAAEAEASAVAEAEAAKAAELEAANAAEAEAAKLAEEEAAAAEAARVADEEAAKAAEAEAAKAAEDEAAKAAEAEATAAAEAAAAAEASAAAEAEAAKAAQDDAVKAAEAEAAKAAKDDAAKAAEAEAAKAAEAEKTAEPTTEATAEPTVAATEPAPEPVDAPTPTLEAVNMLEQLLVSPSEGAAEAPVAAAAADPTATAAEPTVETTTQITEADARSSTEEFSAKPVAVEGGKKSGLSDLEKVGLVALGALVVGAILTNGDEVVSNSGDRVVVKSDSGDLRVLKDDDTLLRRPGSTVRTETFADGSTRTTLDREDGSQITTIRDASGRVLRRARIDASGLETLLIDDLTPVERIEVSTLPAPRPPLMISTSDGGGSLTAALADIQARENMRAYSLRQIREYREVRALAPTIDVDNITFASGSAAIEVTEAEKLAQLGKLIADVIRERPYELFLIEGHTDAVGSAGSNLALSDRRAETVALALTEYFGVPPENLVVQGYGEAELRIPTEADESRNRRVAVRLISPLMQTASLR
jgi:outer membrane protein OmpA-like peptidoglycan-associated protein